MDRRIRDPHGLIGGLVALVLGGWVMVEAGRFSMLGQVFPRSVALVLLAMAVLLLARVAIGREPRPELAPGSHLRRLGLVAAAVLWVFLLPRLGFMVASVIGFALAVAVASFEPWTPRRLAAYAFAAVAVVGGFQLLFAWALRVPLPRGRWLALAGIG